MKFSLKFENTHTVVITRSEVVERGVRRENPVSVSVFASLVDLYSSIHVPEAHGAIL